jgi:hypothetical protein
MASRARGELQRELARFWKDEVKAGRQPWNERPAMDFARFANWLRIQAFMVMEDPEPAVANMLLGKMLVRFGEFLEVREQVHLGLEAERGALGGPFPVFVQRTVGPPSNNPGIVRGVIQGESTIEILQELAQAVERLRRDKGRGR